MKIRDILEYIAFALIVIPILFFSELINTKALELNLESINSLDRNGGKSLAVIYDGTTYYAIFSPDSFYSDIDTDLTSYYNKSFNPKTNYQGIENVSCVNFSRYWYTGTRTTCSNFYRLNPDTNEWVRQLTMVNQNTLVLNNYFNAYVVGFWNLSYNGEIFWLKTLSNANYDNRLFLPNYNVNWLLGLNDFIPDSSYDIWFNSDKFNNILSSNENTDTPNSISTRIYNDIMTSYNDSMYNLSTYNTDSIYFQFDTTNIPIEKYDMYFYITYKTYFPLQYDSDIFYSLIYTFDSSFNREDNNVYVCNIIQDKIKKETYDSIDATWSYQIPYKCQGVDLSLLNGSSQIRFLFNSPYGTTIPENNWNWFNNNLMILSGTSHNYFGLSNIDLIPTENTGILVPEDFNYNVVGTYNPDTGEIEIDGGSNSDIGNWIILLSNYFDKNATISKLFTLPISIYQKMLLALNNSTCSNIYLGTLLGTPLYLPCVNVSQYIGSALWSTIDIILCGVTLLGIRRTLISIYFDMITLRRSERIMRNL